jgi:SAM-dependent methyltransferase
VVVIREMVRVCRPGGKILLGELNPSSPWQWWRRIKATLGVGAFVGASWHRPRGLLAALTASGCDSQLPGRAIFWPPLNLADVLHWRSTTEWAGAKLWSWAGAYYVLIGTRKTNP